MPFLTHDGVRHFYRLEGRDDLPTLVLVHSVGCDQWLWDEQLPPLLDHFRVLRYDIRGHGASDATPGDYTMDLLAGDLLAMVDALGIDHFALCGLSLGGMIALRTAVLAPERVTQLVLANTTPYFGDSVGWDARSAIVLEQGMAGLLDGAMGRSFSPETVAAGEPCVASFRRVLLGTDPVGYVGCCAAIRDMDQRPSLPGVRVPTLVIGGDRDTSTPWEGHSTVLAAGIPGARAVRLHAAHLSNLERPRGFLAALLDFLLPRPDDSLEAGFAVRRAMLGDAHVDRSLADATALNAEFQEFITRYAWGAVWTRPGLDRRMRRLLVLAATASLGRWEEFRLHVRTGLAKELEPSDLKEVLMQLAVYAGVPAANTGFHVAAEEMARAEGEAEG
jgi:3-oxoadipate enol-lactonase/4-carboxymuconolactone decarboxylase